MVIMYWEICHGCQWYVLRVLIYRYTYTFFLFAGNGAFYFEWYDRAANSSCTAQFIVSLTAQSPNVY